MKKIKIRVDDFELRLIIRALVEWRNSLLKEDKPTEDVDGLLIRFCTQPIQLNSESHSRMVFKKRRSSGYFT